MSNALVYLGLYGCDDGHSLKSCQMVVVYGVSDECPTKLHQDYSWKYVNLVCPHCQFQHQFKRICWLENYELPWPSEYYK